MKERQHDIEMSLPRETASTMETGGVHPEDEFTEYQPFNWKRFFFAPKYIPIHLTIILVIIATIFITLYHDQVVDGLRPVSEKVRDLPAGWLIPVAILIIISFPPLFGHEIVGLLCGVIYGLWIGFAIVAAGTFIGEIGTWFLFKRLLRNKAIKMERTNLTYGALARLTRDGGFWIVLACRFSVLPGHMTTAIFSTCDVKFWVFAVATFLTLPKQLIIVYLGVLLIETQDDSTVKTVVVLGTGAVTVLVALWIWKKLNGIKKVLLAEQAERKAAFEARATSGASQEHGSSAPIPYQAEYTASGAPQVGTYDWQRGDTSGSSSNGRHAPQQPLYNPYDQSQDQRYQNAPAHYPKQPGLEEGYASPAGYQPPAEQEHHQQGDIGYAYGSERRYDPSPGSSNYRNQDQDVSKRGYGLNVVDSSYRSQSVEGRHPIVPRDMTG